MFYGQGGYDFDTVYNLPNWLRNFIYRQIVEHYEKKAEAAQGNSGSQTLQKAPPSSNQVGSAHVIRRPARK